MSGLKLAECLWVLSPDAPKQTRVVPGWKQPRVIPWPTSPAHCSTFPRYITFLKLFFFFNERYFYSPLQEDKLKVVTLYLPASRGSSWHLDMKSFRTLLALSCLTFAWMQPSTENSRRLFPLGEVRWSPFGTGYPTRQRAAAAHRRSAFLISNRRATATWQHGV